MSNSTEVSIVEVDGKKIVIPKADQPKSGKPGVFEVPVKLNRQQRRSMERRATGMAGKKTTRQRPAIKVEVESEDTRAAREFHESQERTIEAARNIRDASAGRFWLPGDK